MHSFILSIAVAASQVSCSIIPRAQDGGFQEIPTTAKADNTFSNGKPETVGGFPFDDGPIPELYQPRDIDIPFGRQFYGNMSMFRKGEVNHPDFNTAQWTPDVYDSASQSACGIPDNSYLQMKVAIHPYFLKYAGLDRYCMQDVCVSFWPENGPPLRKDYTNDMIAKVTDICSIDPNDPSHCATPADIKVDRAKVQVMYEIPVPGIDNADLQKDVYVKGTYWHLTKCWTNALPQPAYRDNWWAQPPLPNIEQWSTDATTLQYTNNQQSYSAKGWPTYPAGISYNAESASNMAPLDDWVPGQEPSWTPIAGGKGYGTPALSNGPPPPSGGSGSGLGGKPQVSSGNSTASLSNLNGAKSPNVPSSKAPSSNAPASNAPASNAPAPNAPAGQEDLEDCEEEEEEA